MHLTPREEEKLLLHYAGALAKERRARGLRLNCPEAVALISAELLERVREGMSVAQVMNFGTHILNTDDVMEGVADMVREVQIEATFPDGTKLVTVHNPIRGAGGGIVPGEIITQKGTIVLNADRPCAELCVVNTGDRPIQVGSHFHFFEANKALAFDREQAFGMRLDIPSGTAVRFEPGEEKTVSLVAVGGARRGFGLNGLTNGSFDDPAVKKAALSKAKEQGYKGA